MYSLIIFLSLLINANAVAEAEAHEFHLSKTTINYDTEETAIQISTRIFLDDLELSLKQLGYDSLQICTKWEKEEAELYMYKYLKDNLIIAVDGVEIEYEFLGKEPSDDLAAVWCYLEAYDVTSFNTIEVANTILTTQFDDQKNITMIQVDKNRIAHLLFTTDHTYEAIEN